MNKNLIIARVGDNSLHPEWIKDKNKDFDLFLSYFGNSPQKYIEDADYYEQVKGGKWPELSRIISENEDIIFHYDAIWMPDDDILMNTDSINRMFALFKGFDLELAQPALSLDSYYSHPNLLTVEHSIIRYCNFVEVMAPIFSKKCLKKISHTLSESPSGWGLDLLWPSLIKEESNRNIGIIDAAPMIHTRPIGGELYKKNPELSPAHDIKKLQKIYPHIKINPSKLERRFKVYSQAVNVDSSSDLSALIKGYLQRKRSRNKSKKIAKFNIQKAAS